MKTFVISIVLFLSMSLAIAANSIYINNVTNTVEELTNSLSETDDCTNEVLYIYELWRKNLRFLSISVSFHETEVITEAILSMQIYAGTPSVPEFKYAKAKLIEAVSEIRIGEKFSISNII